MKYFSCCSYCCFVVQNFVMVFGISVVVLVHLMYLVLFRGEGQNLYVVWLL